MTTPDYPREIAATVKHMQKMIDALIVERDELKADAERYRFLRNTHSLETAIWEALDMAESESYQMALDAAVDASMEKAP